MIEKTIDVIQEDVVMMENLIKNDQDDQLEEENIIDLSLEETEYSSLGLYMKDICKYPRLTAEEELRLGEIIQKDLPEKKEAIHRLVNSNLKLVINVAKKYRGHGLEFADLVAEGNFGLFEAAKKFDPEKKFRFSTYATLWIRQKITRALINYGSTIRIPVGIKQEISRLQKIKADFKEKYNREPDLKELAEIANLSPIVTEHYLSYMYEYVELDAPITPESDVALIDIIEYPQTASLSYMDNITFYKTLDSVLDNIPARDGEVLKMRYGLYGYRPMTLEEIGERFNLSRERVRQIETKTLRKLKKYHEIAELKESIT